MLLGLGVNFCPTPLRLTMNIDKSIERFERDLDILSVFDVSKNLIPLANLKIYVRSKWTPPAWDISLVLKRRTQTFRKALEPKFRFRPVQPLASSSVTPSLMIIQTYKGLGPGAIEPREYVRYDIRDHLGDMWT